MTPPRPAVLLATAVLLASTPRPADAQRQLALDATPLHGTLSYGWPVGKAVVAGVDVGIGVSHLDVTLEPPDAEFEPTLHVGSFLRTAPNRSVTVEAGVRSGLAELRECDASDCYPDGFIALTGAVFLGGERVQFGPRVWVGRVGSLSSSRRETASVVWLLSGRYFLRR